MPSRIQLLVQREDKISPQPKPIYVAFELCCGSANLCRALNTLGCRAIGFDHSYNKQKPVSAVVLADLSTQVGQRVVENMELEHDPHVVHAGPPCGTASRAREKQISYRLRNAGAPCPPPLRSDDYPLGIPGLSKQNLAKVNAANSIYFFVLNYASDGILQERGFHWRTPQHPSFGLLTLPWSCKDFPEYLLWTSNNAVMVDLDQCGGAGVPTWTVYRYLELDVLGYQPCTSTESLLFSVLALSGNSQQLKRLRTRTTCATSTLQLLPPK